MKLHELKIINENGRTLGDLVKQDQNERNEYKKFVQTEVGGDWERGAELYAKMKNRKPDDIFGERERLIRFTKMKFEFSRFSDGDWGNYWLLAQHCDFDIRFQREALVNIERYMGRESSEYKYIYDRVSCNMYGRQKYGTQDICVKI